MELLKLVVFSLYFGFVWCEPAKEVVRNGETVAATARQYGVPGIIFESYKAAVVEASKADLISANQYASLIDQATKLNVDLLVLPTPKRTSVTSDEPCNGLNYDEVVKAVSAAAKHAGMYVVAPLHETISCHSSEELVTSNLVFDRKGALISVYRKLVNSFAKCNITTSRMGRFTTDFGPTFGVMVEDDLILTNAQEMDGIKNFIVTDTAVSKKSFSFAKQFSSSWAFTNNVNVISPSGLISSQDILERASPLIVATLETKGSGRSLLIASPPTSFPSNDLSQYVTRPLNLEASAQGYSDSVCHDRFCCQFYVKTSVIGTNSQNVSYGLVAFDGVHQLGSNTIGLQTCAVVACVGLYKRSCFIGSESNITNIKFNEISINANFSKENSAQFPTILTTTQTVFNTKNLKFSIENKDYKHVSTQMYNTENILTFGIIGRDYSKDFKNTNDNNREGIIFSFSEYISSENVQEFFDYVWIRLRILIFIVSVYILEMM